MLINCLVAGYTTTFGHCGIPEIQFLVMDSFIIRAGVTRINIVI